jgi:hypothetical protein
MSYANDSILVTPGSGATVATHLAQGKEHQAVVITGGRGHIWGTADCFIVDTALSANVAAARTTHFDLFNASGSGVVLEIHGVFILPALTAVAGIGLTWELILTSAVGTGGSSLTPRKLDTTNNNLPAQVTARGKPTGGATTNYILTYMNSSSEETSPYAGMASILNHLAFAASPDVQTITLNEGEGIKVDQTFNSSIGTTNIRVVFSVK